MEDSPYPLVTMPLPWPLRWYVAILFTTFALAVASALWLERFWLMVFGFVWPVFAWLYMRTAVRCPRCRRRLPLRILRSLHAWEDKHFHYYDCPQCQVTWDPSFVTNQGTD